MLGAKIHHLAVLVHDLDRAARFYGELLGLPELRRHFDDDQRLRSIWYGLGDAFLAVERAATVDRRGAEDEPRWHCVALSIEASEREAWRERLRANGAPVERETDFTIYFRDPEQNLLALSHYPTRRS